MFNILIDKLPETVEVNCQEVSINSDFRVFILFEQILHDHELSKEDKVKKCLSLFYNEEPSNLVEAIEKVNSGDYRIYSDCDSMTDIAYQVVEECGYLNNVPDTVARYFDYEAFGRDSGIEGTFIFLDDGSCLEVIR